MKAVAHRWTARHAGPEAFPGSRQPRHRPTGPGPLAHWQLKFAASSVLPLPRYTAFFG